jgi:hypothetical protein
MGFSLWDAVSNALILSKTLKSITSLQAVTFILVEAQRVCTANVNFRDQTP